LEQIKGLEGWTLQSGKLHKAYKFKDFVEAFGFMTQVGVVQCIRPCHD
jgi:4a-hydroxytetrahydrobiopterin dehydratase